MEQTIIISSESLSLDDSLEALSVESYGSGIRKIPTKTVTKTNKSSTFTAKHKSDNKETTLEKPHQDAFTSKQEALEIIKRLHIKCGFFDTEHLFMIPKTWLEYQQYKDVQVEITKNLYNTYCMPRSFYVEKYFESWDTKIYGQHSLMNAGTKIIIHLQCF